MKKIFLLFLLVIIQTNICSALENVNVDYVFDNNAYHLIVHSDDKKITYSEAVEKFNLEKYMRININGKYHFFFLGEEIDKQAYDDGLEIETIKKRCDNSNEKCIYVQNTADVINKIDEIYNSNKAAIFYLYYKSSDKKNIDFMKIDTYFSNKYISDMRKNIYTYDEYAYRKPEKFLPSRDANGIYIDTLTILTDSEEQEKVDEFVNLFLKKFNGKSDYEKVLGAYVYINNTTSYEKDVGYAIFKDALLSSYDVFFGRKSACVGVSTAFQLLMERLGIESYIVDHVSTNDTEKYVTTHTYNIVKLDGKWYIVDIAFDDKLSGLLKGMSKDYSLEDFKYYDIKIADSSYFDTHSNVTKTFDFDYSALLDLTLEIDKKSEKKEEIIQEKKSYIKEYILIGVILVVIIIIIWFFTRKR